MNPINPNIARTSPPPVMEARRWIEGVSFPPERPLINVSQAAPVAPPPKGLRQAIAEAALTDDTAHLYGPVLGLPALREEVARQVSTLYRGAVAPDQVAITAGCNQAFAAAIATLAGPGDEVILPVPWYFNHKMWLDMSGVTAVPLATGAELLPTIAAAEDLITPRTRAIVLVTPNNPGGVEYPADLVAAFHDLARTRGLALILDETYRDFDSRPAPAHSLFTAPDWDETLIHLYSFSKAYRLTGHRVGALIAAPGHLAQVEKFLDTVTICPNQLGQRAALWGMRNLAQWLAGERAEILARRAAIETGFATLPGWHLLGVGAYFAYLRHPFDEPAEALCQRMVREIGLLALPGTMFRPEDDPSGPRELRIAFANIDANGIAEMFRRLAALAPG
ncbi:aminotransferase [Maritimibacter sp. HL-12]|uniref:aminotransferase n=1 Tax=Maritimibacter sp. HL-12 TaxID=1162418 RepID=UPI000A0F3AA3|nr:aminotransferase [Maritimibacter sp. HL-12]SMH29942.1 Aspartate/methionine/tyrosine aminotransferase [Maritimibacter sp. HL-12]